MTAVDHPNSEADIVAKCGDQETTNTYKNTEESRTLPSAKLIGTDYSYKHEIVWINAIVFLFMHVCGVAGLFIVLTLRVSTITIFWTYLVLSFGALGITVGAHRLYTHRCFKAKPLLRAICLIAQTNAGQNSMFTWVRDHRLHHRYSDTDADPHNAKRGFFFSHMGWLMSKKHPYVMELGRRIDISDLESDWMVMFQKKYYLYIYFIVAIFIPVMVPVYFLGETFLNSVLVSYFMRYIIQLNGTWLVNSAAHLSGTRPYDKNLQPVESWFVSWASFGEGWHNYHHAFPWDYKAAELTTTLNCSANVIQLLEKLGLAYDLKTANPEMVANRVIRTGDGTHFDFGNDEARRGITAPFFRHPINPWYTVNYAQPETKLKEEGLPLFHEKDILSVSGHVLRKRSANSEFNE